MATSSIFFLLLLLLITVSVTDGIEVTLVNNCKESIWLGLLGTAGHVTPREGGFHLPSGEQADVEVPEGWSGRIWPRQGCCFDESTGRGSCQTGDCAGLMQCGGLAGVPPACIVEMTLGTPQSDLHFYDVSLVDGFNVPVSMTPVGGVGVCGVAGCQVDLNACCPPALAVTQQGRVVGCKSACLAAKTDRYCCTGQFTDPDRCKPTALPLMMIQEFRPVRLLAMLSHFVLLIWTDDSYHILCFFWLSYFKFHL